MTWPLDIFAGVEGFVHDEDYEIRRTETRLIFFFFHSLAELGKGTMCSPAHLEHLAGEAKH